MHHRCRVQPFPDPVTSARRPCVPLYNPRRAPYWLRMSRRQVAPPSTSSADASPVAADAPVTFEAMLAEVERITALLERGDLPLEQSLASFERATHLAQEAQRLLERAEGRLTRLIETGPGEVGEVPFDLDGESSGPLSTHSTDRRVSPPLDDED